MPNLSETISQKLTADEMIEMVVAEVKRKQLGGEEVTLTHDNGDMSKWVFRPDSAQWVCVDFIRI